MSKVSIEGNASGTGTLTIAAPNTNSNFTLDIPAASGTLDRLNRAGNVLQVVQSVRTASFVTTSTSFVATGLSASITPTSATSKILIFTHTITDNAANARTAIVTIYRGATDLGGGSNEGFGGASSDTGGSTRSSFDICYLDSPATTSSTTYALYTRSITGGTIEVPPYAAAKQTITLMEIAA